MATRRERLFHLLALLLPVAFFALLEGGARLVWRTGATPVFVEAPVGNGRFLLANPALASRWFAAEARPPAPSPELMRREKPARGFRVFVLGESTAQGFPYPRTGAFSRALAPMLRDLLPNDTVEVINLGIAATNSFSMLDILDELLEHRPDAIVYYGGHNEYYGAFGAGSAVGVPGSDGVARIFLRLQRLRSVRLANHLIGKARRRGTSVDGADASFMGAVARDRAIALGGPVYARGVQQYEANLTRIVRRARRAGVAMYLASVASNERDHRPFSSPDNAAADSAFARGMARLAAGDSTAARDAFAEARDLDLIRFRAPSAFVEVARRVAAAEDAVYVPVAEAFAAASPAGSPGRELFLEHVHPNAAGSWLIARTVVDRMLAAPPAGWRLAAADLAEDRFYKEGRALTPFDDRVVHHRLRALTVRWPFVPADAQGDYFGTYRPVGPLDSLAFLVAAGAMPWELAKLEAGAQFERGGELAAALAEYRGVMLDSPEFGAPWRASGEALLRAGRLAAADSMFAAAMRAEPTAAVARARAQIAAAERRWPDAVQQWQYVVGQQPNDAESMYRLSLALALAGDSTAARATAGRLLSLRPTDPAHRVWVRMLLSAR
jgi:lysophospholipase L1-like esterase